MAGIYVHVPFCHAKCAYCDFYSVARRESASAYVDAVLAEYAARRHELGGEPVRTLYFGGGTPSVLPVDGFARLAETLMAPTVEEFTMEVNPEDVDAGRLAAWRSAGVGRISIGVESLVDAELKAVNRRHSADGALRAIEAIGRAGIDNISADLIYGLPGQTAASWRSSLERLIATGITHLSAYCLSYEEGTLLWRRLMRGDISEASDEVVAEMYGILCETAASAGFEHYEISNFALPGMRSRHNSNYWLPVPYLGLGPGAHSLTGAGLRRYNEADLKAYLLSPADFTTDDPETDAERVNDIIMTALRTSAGLDIDALPAQYAPVVRAGAEQWLRRGALVASDAGFRIAESSWLVADAIIRDLMVD